MRLAVVEGDNALCAGIAREIRSAGHRCTEFHSGEAFRRALYHESYDLVVVDQQLADIASDELLGWMRNSLPWSPPVILMTPQPSRGGSETRLNPADDCLPRSDAVESICDHAETVLQKRFGATDCESGIEYFGRYAFDSRARRVTLAGKAIPVTAKVFSLALLFFRNLDRPLSRGHLCEAIWGRLHADSSRTLDAHISLVRARLQLLENGQRLGSIYGFGYKLEQI